MKANNKKFNFKHSLGQNFIIDEFLLDDICDDCGIQNTDFVLEIGSGNGALTRCLCERAKYVITIEIDKSLIPLLNSNLADYNNVSIINADFINYDFKNIIDEFIKQGYNYSGIKVVANVPYYITSPIINKLLYNPTISEMTLMVQKEVAERIVAIPDTKDYGILTILCNYFSSTSLLMIVPKNFFYPVPKVDSAVVCFKKFDKYIFLDDKNNIYDITQTFNDDFTKLFHLVKSSFSQRRKKLLNTLSNVMDIDKEILIKIFNKLGFSDNCRAENLSLSSYQNLLRELKQINLI